MLSVLAAVLSLLTGVLKYIDRQGIEAAGRAKEQVAAWERNNGFVARAMAAGEAKRTELESDPSKLRERDANFKDD